MIGVVVPAHNEEALIERCVISIQFAAASERLAGESVLVLVVMDACSDKTADILKGLAVETLSVNVSNVGRARALGAEACLDRGCRWLAFTDADSEVGEGWLADQLSLSCDAVCGTVAVRDWGSYGSAMQSHYERTYSDIDGHRHIHGANLGLSAKAYRMVGGFAPLTFNEDVSLVRALEEAGIEITWSAKPRVHTSARAEYRAPQGFGATLARVHADKSAQNARMSGPSSVGFHLASGG